MGLNVKETVFNVTAYRLLPWTVADKVVGIIGFFGRDYQEVKWIAYLP